ncbi:MAG TPA: transglycosylase domain-containing protein, partial [Vicinamibacterales bacterium]
MTIVRTPAADKASRPRKSTRKALRRRGWKFYVLAGVAAMAVLCSSLTAYYYVVFSRMIDARLSGELRRADPRIFARPFSVQRGERLSLAQMVDRLNELGYTERAPAEHPGEFAIGRGALAVIPRGGDHAGRTVRFVFSPPPRRLSRARVVSDSSMTSGGTLVDIQVIADHSAMAKPAGATSERARRATPANGTAHTGLSASEPGGAVAAKPAGITFDAPLLTALVVGREKRRDVPLGAISPHVAQAVIAIEDHRFYDHAGVDPIGTVRAVLLDLFGRRKYLQGGSTITQQLVRTTFLTDMWGAERATSQRPTRKFAEWLMSVALERRLSKDKILELYLNDVYVGQRGSFAIHGVPEAARLFFAKDVSNLSVAEAAAIAGVIRSPPYYSPFTNPAHTKERRNVVLHAMADAGYITADAADAASREPLQIVARALEAEAPYFVDFVTQELQEKSKAAGAVDVYTTLDLQLQRIAQDAVRAGLLHVDAILSHRRKRAPAQAALIAIDPRTGEILAMVGGRSYNQSQYNRAVNARRQPGSVFKPFVYLAAFERAAAEGRTDVTPATIVDDEPTSFTFNQQTWTPANFDNEYDGPITLRRALAFSRNVATVKVAESTGYDYV